MEMSAGKAERSIYRYTVPVDDRWHKIELSGPIVQVAGRTNDPAYLDRVEFWAVHGGPSAVHELRVFGTGHPLPDVPLTHHGTAFAARGSLVWHLMERNPPTVVVLDGTQ